MTKILVVGDSVGWQIAGNDDIYGIGPLAEQVLAQLDPDTRKLLEGIAPNRYGMFTVPDWDVINAGFPGSGAARELYGSTGNGQGGLDVLGVLEWADGHLIRNGIKAFQPDRVVMHFGGNNWCWDSTHTTLEDFNTPRWESLSVAGLLDCIDDAIAGVGAANVCVITGLQACFFCQCDNSWSAGVDYIGNWGITQLAAARPGIKIVDVSDFAPTDLSVRWLDCIHLSDGGVRVVVDRVRQAFGDNFTGVPPTKHRVNVLDIIELRKRRRAETVKFEVLDQSLNVIGTVNPRSDSPPDMSVDTGEQAKRTLSNFHLEPADTAEIDPIRHRIRPSWVVQADPDPPALYPLGVFLFAAHPRDVTRDLGGIDRRRAKSTLNDQWQAIDSARRGPFTIATTTRITSAVAALVAECGIVHINIEESNLTPPVDAIWPPGESRLKIIHDIILFLGYVAYFDNNGTFVAKPAPNPAADPATRYYDTDSHPFFGPIYVEDDDVWNAPNVFEVISNGANQEPIWGIYELPASAPQSKQNRGYDKVKQFSAQGVPDNNTANVIAYLLALLDKGAYTYFEFDAAPDPRHDSYDLVNFLGVPCIELAHKLKCAPGGHHHHRLARVYPDTGALQTDFGLALPRIAIPGPTFPGLP